MPVPSTITTQPGRKSEGDLLIKFHGHLTTLHEQIFWFLHYFDSEDSNYREGRGGDMILDMLLDLRNQAKSKSLTEYLHSTDLAEFYKKWDIHPRESR